MVSSWRLLGTILLLLVATLGCGRSGPGTRNPGVLVHAVTGTVLLDGSPVEGATVVFRGGERGASGVTGAEGAFRLTTFDAGDGALEGSYGVAITKTEIVGADPSYGDVDSPNYGKKPPPSALGKEVSYIAKKFAKPETSGLSANVTDGENEFTFEVTSK